MHKFNDNPVCIQGIWDKITVRQYNGTEDQLLLEASFQNVSNNGLFSHVQAPDMTYIPEKNRMIIMAVSRDYDGDMLYKPVLFISDDLGENWLVQNVVLAGMTVPFIGWISNIGYLGNGHLLMHLSSQIDSPDAEAFILQSLDYGETWTQESGFPSMNGQIFNTWGNGMFFTGDDFCEDGFLLMTGYVVEDLSFLDGGKSRGGFRISMDKGKTWGKTIIVPQWHGYNEISIIKSGNGDWIAACRSDIPPAFIKTDFDHYSGFGISISTDHGSSWSDVHNIYEWGRHFASMVSTPDGNIVLSYVVRLGYPVTDNNFGQFGLEAIVSKDYGRTWDLDHRYVLKSWTGSTSAPLGWICSAQSTKTVQLPDLSFMTVYSSGENCDLNRPFPYTNHYEVCLVRWQLNSNGLNQENNLSNADPRSDLRNKTCPYGKDDILNRWMLKNRNIAIIEQGARIQTTSCDGNPESILYDRYTRPIRFFETLPAYITISWPHERFINEIHIHAGAPELKTAGKIQGECVPTAYRLQYQIAGQWLDLVAPICIGQYYKGNPFIVRTEEFEEIYMFEPVFTNTIRMIIMESSDTGKRGYWRDSIIIPTYKRKTAIRRIEVMERR